jgi:hypothetical protein
MLGVRESIDQTTRENIDQLDLGVTDDEPARRANSDRDLERELQGEPAWRRDLALAGHGVLHGERRGGCARPVVSVEPARDRVAAEIDDVAAVAIELRDHSVEDAVQVAGQDLRRTL